jgi:hypothetical protein
MKLHRRRQTLVLLGLIPLVAALWFGCSDEDSPTAPVDINTPPPVVTVDTIPPASVNELVVKSPGVESLALQWVAPGNNGWEGCAAGYDIRYSNSPITEANWDQAFPIPRMPAPFEGGRVQKCRAIGLVPATSYYFALKTYDHKSNESEISNVAYGTTKQERMPPSHITDLLVSEVGTGMYLLTWTARGDDGVLGTASRYDVRYGTNGVVNESNWSTATQVSDVPPPKASGEPESLIVTVNHSDRNHAFAIKVGDEVTNWSEVSNPGLGLGRETGLWAYPENLQPGENLMIAFRAPGDQQVDVEVYYAMGQCGLGDVQLFSGMPEAGIYLVTYDFFDAEADEYLDPNWYQISVCVDGERRDLDRVQLAE